MAITPTVPNHDDSPFYKIMEDKGKVWNGIADEVGAKIQGFYNAYIVEFEMTQQVDSGEVRVFGKRELTTVHNSSVFSEVLSLQLKAKGVDKSKFIKVGRGGILNIFFNLTGNYSHKTSISSYKIKYNSASTLDKIVKTGIFKMADINRLSIGPDGLSLEIQEIPKDIKVARKIRDFWRVVL